jgi:hypothetical protein
MINLQRLILLLSALLHKSVFLHQSLITLLHQSVLLRQGLSALLQLQQIVMMDLAILLINLTILLMKTILINLPPILQGRNRLPSVFPHLPSQQNLVVFSQALYAARSTLNPVRLPKEGNSSSCKCHLTSSPGNATWLGTG